MKRFLVALVGGLIVGLAYLGVEFIRAISFAVIAKTTMLPVAAVIAGIVFFVCFAALEPERKPRKEEPENSGGPKLRMW